MKKMKIKSYRKFIILFALTILLSCSSNEQIEQGIASYEINLEVKFSASGYTLDVIYINDGNNDKIRFDKPNDDRMSDTSFRDAEEKIGVRLESFRTIPTSNIKIIIKNLNTGKIVVNKNITKGLAVPNYVTVYYDIKENEIKEESGKRF